jgi:hypothetical protein
MADCDKTVMGLLAIPSTVIAKFGKVSLRNWDATATHPLGISGGVAEIS